MMYFQEKKDQSALLDSSQKFVLDDFSNQRPFSSFLPGIAGLTGIPMWVFYVNRGQAISSFGVESKDKPMLEFQPANKAYRETPLTGFRTFIKILSAGQHQIYEPFSLWLQMMKTSRKMIIRMNELEIQEIHPELGLQIKVLYFTLPGESFAGLVRKVTLTNQSKNNLEFEILDGLPVVIPYGANNSSLKEISRTIEAWMGVYNLEKGLPFYRLRASTEDSAQVESIEAGHFAVSCCVQQGKTIALPPIIDPDLIFGQNTALVTPDRFIEKTLDHLLSERQITSGKTPCGFFGFSTTLTSAESLDIYTVFGHIGNEGHLSREVEKLRSEKYLENKRRQANDLVFGLTEAVATKTGLPGFDAYCRQTYLDNMLRGGSPILLGDAAHPVVYYVYSRKHGDPERDYNAFKLAPQPYSRGEGNYRDVNQNQRCDVFFHPQIQDFNIRAFMSLIQADGYNPLVIKGTSFSLTEEKRIQILAQVDQPERLEAVLSRPFKPGELLQYITDHEITLQVSPEDFLASVLRQADHDFEASHGEGFWIDHWTYNLDLIDSYLAVYPDRKEELFFGVGDLPFYDSPYIVLPRSKKYVLADGLPRQFGAVVEDPQKMGLIASRELFPNWVRMKHGHGEIYRTSLFNKLVVLAVVKFTTLDPYGMGIEMEANKPGWYDALNGLPGLFGSSMSETYELLRLVRILVTVIEEREPFTVEVPVEIRNLMDRTSSLLKEYYDSNDPEHDFHYWDEMAETREVYRSEIRLGFEGSTTFVPSKELLAMLKIFDRKLTLGIERAVDLNNGFPPTYFTYEVEDYETLPTQVSDHSQEDQLAPNIRVKRLKANALPEFLEGVVKALKLQSDRKAALDLYHQVKSGPLYDRKLKMYKVNASLENESNNIGRARAFTPGWLENESIWLHMEYKFLLEVLKSGLYSEFFEDFRDSLIPFQDPLRYGRSTLENSSFIVSSAHPDENLHGAGFVARLSGATAEFLSMWQYMLAGEAPFYMQGNALCLLLKPILPDWLFDEKDTVTFTFLGHCKVVYHNPQRLDTWLLEPVSSILHPIDHEIIRIEGNIIRAPYADMVRTGQVGEIHVTLEDRER